MPSHRPVRIAEQIHRELSSLFLTDVKDPRVTPISITSVDVKRDLRRAEILYTPLGGGEPSDQLVEALNDVARQLRGPVARAIGVRFAPELVFRFDKHLDAAVRVTSLIDQIGRSRKTDDEESP